MIWLSNPRTGFVKSFQSYKELSIYFNKLEYTKQESGQTEQWGFIFLPYAHNKILHEHEGFTHPSKTEQFAFERQLDLIEIHKGNTVYPEQIPIVSGIDIKLLRRDWCWSYARHSKHKLWDEELCKLDNSEEGEFNLFSCFDHLPVRDTSKVPANQEDYL